MAILKTVSPTQRGTDYGRIGYSQMVDKLEYPPAPGRRMLGDEMITPANTLRGPQQMPAQGSAPAGAAGFDAPNNMVAEVPNTPSGFRGLRNNGLRYANVNGATVLLPRDLRASTGSDVTEGAQAWMARRDAERMANRPSDDEMAQRRADYQQRAQGRATGLREGRLARLAQQQQMNGQPITPLAAESLQNAHLGLAGSRGDFDRDQSRLNNRVDVRNLRRTGRAETELGVDRARQLGTVENDMAVGRLRGLALAGGEQDVLDAQKKQQDQQLAGRVAEAEKLGMTQQALDQQQRAQELADAQAETKAQQDFERSPSNAPLPDFNDLGATSTWLGDLQYRMTPEEFGAQMKGDARISPSQLQDILGRMQNERPWWESSEARQRRESQQGFLRKALGMPDTPATQPSSIPYTRYSGG
jgi:hypothetical protein